MIDADMDIEADLGIDSIKRVEILSALEENMPGLPTVAPDQIGKLKTLQQIVSYFASGTPAEMMTADNPVTVDTAPAENLRPLPRPDAEILSSQSLNRQVVKVVHKEPGKRLPVMIPDGRKVYITEDGSGLSAAIADKLGRVGDQYGSDFAEHTKLSRKIFRRRPAWSSFYLQTIHCRQTSSRNYFI